MSPDRGVEKRVLAMVEAVMARIFVPMRNLHSTGERALLVSWVLAMFVGGAVVWANVLNAGDIPFDVQDWPQEWQYYSILKQAFTEGILPLHISPATLIEERFLAIPQVVISPQVILLKSLSLGQFVLLNVILMYSIGLLGCLLIARRYGLSLVTFTLLGLLFGLNGHIVTHLSVGHSMWLGYYLFPFFFLIVLRVVEDDAPKHWPVWMGLTLFGMILQGSVYPFVWSSLFLGLLWVVSRGKRRPILLSLLLAAGLSALRIGPTMMLYSQSKHNFFGGFVSLLDLISALAADTTPYQLGVGRAIGWWEFDTYLSVLGVLFVFSFAIYPFLRRGPGGENALDRYRSLLFPAAVLTLFSIGYFYLPIQSLPLPFISLVRVPSRFLVVPVVLLTLLASISAQDWLNRRPPRLALGAVWLAGLLVVAQDLVQHARAWRIWNIALALPEQRRDLVESLRIANHSDPAYTTVLLISVGLSVIFLAASLFVLARPRALGNRARAG